MSVIDDILFMLRNGDWCDLKDIAQKIAVPPTKALLIFDFLAEFDFIHLNKNTKRVKLQLPLLKFMNDIQHLEYATT
jgi:DNA-binding IclR family transcriptional regulator